MLDITSSSNIDNYLSIFRHSPNNTMTLAPVIDNNSENDSENDINNYNRTKNILGKKRLTVPNVSRIPNVRNKFNRSR